MTGTNWAGNLTYSATKLLEPTSVEELQSVVAAAPHLRALGSRHSFNSIADTDGVQVSVAALPPEFSVNADRTGVTVSAGLRYGELIGHLDRAGLALHNLASLPHISVGGAIATGTHGSGDRNGSLASAVSALQIMRPDGEVHDYCRGDDDFDGMVVSLGSLGIVTYVSLDVVPTFEVRQDLFENLPWKSVTDHLDEITASAYSVSLFTNWGEQVDQVWLKSRCDDAPPPAELFGATPATRQLHPLPEESAVSTTVQLGVPGPWWDRLPHFQLAFTPSKGAELQTEYLVPRDRALEAIDAVRAIAHLLRPHLFISEIRTVAGDGLWLSPAHSTNCVALHFTWQPHMSEVQALLPRLDDALAPFAARPHWGKLFETDSARLAEAYPRLTDFRTLADRFDPEHRLANDLTSQWLGR